MVTMGTINNFTIAPAIVLKGAVASGAAGTITVHNYPIGDTTPSNEDRYLWRTMREACKLLGLGFWKIW